MDVKINQLNSTVRATDSTSLLDPRVLERIVAQVTQRIEERGEHDARLREEREWGSSSTPEESVG